MTPNVLVRLCHICMITQANLNSTGYILVFLNKKKKLFSLDMFLVVFC